MKRLIVSVFGWILVCVFLLPFAANAQESKNYVVAKLGVYSPQDDLDDFGFDTGFSGEVAFGHYFHRNFALEAGLGYFESELSISGTVGSISGTANFELDVIPLTLTAKGILPAGSAEFYAGVGGGVYFASLDFAGSGTIDSTTLSVAADDDDVVVGGHLVLGVNFDVTSNVFLGVEGKYIFTDDFEVFGVEFAPLDGFMATANIGYRF